MIPIIAGGLALQSLMGMIQHGTQASEKKGISFDDLMSHHSHEKGSKDLLHKLEGSLVQVENKDGTLETGLVEKAEANGKEVNFKVNGKNYKFEQLRNVMGRPSTQGELL
jgi:hypothetical protein